MAGRGTASADGLAQRRGLSDAERADVAALAALCNADEGLELKLSVGVAPDDAGAGGNDFLYYADGTLVGYCALDPGREVELCGMVHPRQRRRGIGSRLLHAAADECRRRGADHLLIICEERSRAGRAFVAATGARYRDAERRMHLDLAAFEPPSAPGPSLPLDLRRAIPADADALARVIAAAFGDPEDTTRRRVERDLAKTDGWFALARLDGAPVGALRIDDATPAANIYAFGVLPPYRRRGLGRRIMEMTLGGLREAGYTGVGLEVDTDNAAAAALYRSVGFAETTTYGYYRLEV